MNLSLRKKILLLLASVAWCFSPYMALAIDNSQDQAEISAPLVVVEVAKPKYKVVSTSVHQITAYTSEVAQCDDSPCITANGFNVCAHGEEDVVAANFLPLGAKIRIPELFGDRVFTVQDRMNRRFPNHVDIWMKDKQQAIKFGTKPAKIEVLAKNNQ